MGVETDYRFSEVIEICTIGILSPLCLEISEQFGDVEFSLLAVDLSKS